MARVLIIGAGVVGLATAMLLESDGHEVVVLERDAALPPEHGAQAWAGWRRAGVNQFHQPHAFLARFRQIVETELPGVAEQLKGEGALRLDLINDVVPTSISGGWQDGDERFELITGRRPFVESVLARAATSRGIVVRRGEAVAGLLAGPSDMRAVPNVIGVRTEHGESIEADLVVDIGGRRSVLPTWLAELGARPPAEERDDSGFMYFGRHFRARNESLPALIGVFRWDWDTISSLCLPADNGTWCLGLVVHAKDKALYGLRRLDRWEAALRSIKLVAHWLDGEPIDDGVSVLTRLEDRHRDLSVDGRPVATGVVAVGDAWAATNPSLGRGRVDRRDARHCSPPDDPRRWPRQPDAIRLQLPPGHRRLGRTVVPLDSGPGSSSSGPRRGRHGPTALRRQRHRGRSGGSAIPARTLQPGPPASSAGHPALAPPSR